MNRRFSLPAGLLILTFFLLSLFSSRTKSPVFDEPPHIAAGISYLQKDVFRPNPQHPPLIKEIAAASLSLAGIRLPQTPAAEAMLHERGRQALEWAVGNDLIARNGPARVLFWARLPVILMSTLLALLIYVWGRRLVGETAALAALFLFVMDPNLLAHSAFVTTDMGLAAFGTLFYFALWRDLRKPSPLRLILCGIAMGLALSTKFSAVFLLPCAAVLMLASNTRGLRGAAPGRELLDRLAGFALAFLTMCLLATAVIVCLYRSPAGLSFYWHGLTTVYADASPDYRFFMAGEQDSRFYSYFAVAWLLKEPIAIVSLVLFGAVMLFRDRSFPVLDKLFIFLPPTVLFAACTFLATDMGIRYIIPAIPFGCLAGGFGFASLIRSQARVARYLAAVLSVWIVLAAVGIYRDQLSYFNEAACLLRDPSAIGWDGGSKCGVLWLDDSNVDWGQGLSQLHSWMSAHPKPGAVYLAYFGSFPPANYGILADPIQIGEFDQVPPSGRYIISAHLVARNHTSWLGAIQPAAIVGHAFYIYDIR